MVCGLSWAGTACAEVSLKEVFTADEYRQAGLDKLSPTEQAGLLQALHRLGLDSHQAVKADSTAVTPAVGPEVTPERPPEKKSLWVRIKDFGAEQLPLKSAKDEGEVTEMDAQLTEPFAGLSGHTLFRLDNGQVWEQRLGEDYYLGKPIPNPKVIIMRTRFGYRLKIPAVGAGFDVAIKRIR